MGTSQAYFKGQFMPTADAKMGIMTHAFHYGTAVFEGIRGNWNEQRGEIYLFRAKEHFERLRRSCKIMQITLPHSDDELVRMATRMVGTSEYKEDIYVRPLAYKSSEALGVRLHNLEDDFLMFCIPFGPYLDLTKGIHCCTSTWRRVADNGIPARAKVTGIYANGALAKTEANLNGFEEAIMLSDDGHVSEGSGENLFMVVDGKLITPPPQDNILVGITRASIIQLAEDELGLETVERSIDRTELYIADEVFLTGTAAHVTAVARLDHREIGNGGIGEITAKLQEIYFAMVKGEVPKYRDWLTPIYAGVTA